MLFAMLEIIDVGDLRGNHFKFAKVLNEKAGEGNWWWVFKSNALYSGRWGFQFYEDAYYQFLKKRPDLLKILVESQEVIWSEPKDIESKLDYWHQTSRIEHFADIAIRRVLVRFGLFFKGQGFLSIKGEELDPKNVPFHLPHLIKTSGSKTVKVWLEDHRKVVIADTIDSQHELSKYLIA